MRWLLTAWLVLLVASNGWRLLHPPIATADPEQRLVSVAEFIDGKRQSGRKQIAIREYGVPGSGAPVLLLHGTPIASKAMRGLGELLGQSHYVISPDMPGFAGSLQPLQDFSSITGAAYLVDLLDALAVEHVHIVAYSQGGAAAIAFAERAPDRLASLALVSTIGVQELELFGSYTLNHAVYAGQLAIWRAVQWLVPHFGYLDNAILGTGYTRNLTDTDQRVLRSMLKQVSAPTLIIHGRSDGMVPYAAAVEHQRLVPHSTLVTLDAGHEPAYANPAMLMPSLEAFLTSVANGTAASRADATATRVSAAAAPFDASQRDPLSGGALLVMLLAVIVASYVSEDLACIAAGLLAAQGVISLSAAIIASLIGLYTGDLALFLAGRWLGPPALARLVPEPRLVAAKHWLSVRGPLVILASRFMPGTRLPTYVAAGALQLPLVRFAAYFSIATLIWTPLLVGLAAAFGNVVEAWMARYSAYAALVIVGAGLGLWLLAKIVPPLFSWEGRRQLLGRWRRLSRFEFWPRWAFYWPVVFANILFAVRYRSLTLFTLANPGMPLGGLAGESKRDILAALQPSGAIPPFTLLPPAEPALRLEALTAFMQLERLAWPVVLKPEHGERGRDVQLVPDARVALEYLTTIAVPVIAQARVLGEEYGALYIRMPGAAAGQITSLARKGPTEITADGQHTLRQLILADERAVCMAPFFLDAFAATLQDTPAEGQVIKLNQIGTHSRGSLFTDASAHNTAALTAALDQISRHFEGFYLGRFDLFAPNAEALANGESLAVVELNGLTSEPAHIYHPGRSVFSAWHSVIQQWHTAWRIGAELRRQGHKPPGVLAVLRGLRNSNYLNSGKFAPAPR
ncbi:MAG: alpha/beta fold hydrolase [Pseudomonadota bacterium]